MGEEKNTAPAPRPPTPSHTHTASKLVFWAWFEQKAKHESLPPSILILQLESDIQAECVSVQSHGEPCVSYFHNDALCDISKDLTCCWMTLISLHTVCYLECFLEHMATTWSCSDNKLTWTGLPVCLLQYTRTDLHAMPASDIWQGSYRFCRFMTMVCIRHALVPISPSLGCLANLLVLHYHMILCDVSLGYVVVLKNRWHGWNRRRWLFAQWQSKQTVLREKINNKELQYLPTIQVSC